MKAPLARAVLTASLIVPAAAGLRAGADGSFAFVQVSSPGQPLRSLMEARMWSDPGPLAPDDLVHGPRVPHAACQRLPVSVSAAPTEATLSWPRRAAAHHYWVQYSVGKFPTQVSLPMTAGQTTVELRVEGLVPGKAHALEICEARDEGGCPAIPGRSCTTVVEVVAPLAFPGVAPGDPTRATCVVEPGVAFAGRSPGYPLDGPQPAASAEECCQSCARALPSRPYYDQCLFFVFDAQARRCTFLRDRSGGSPLPSAASGRVIAWPREP